MFTVTMEKGVIIVAVQKLVEVRMVIERMVVVVMWLEIVVIVSFELVVNEVVGAQTRSHAFQLLAAVTEPYPDHLLL